MLESVLTWLAEHGPMLGGASVQLKVFGPTAYPCRNSVAAWFVKGAVETTIQVWDTGECDIIAMDMNTGDELINSTHEFRSVTGLIGMLTTVAEQIAVDRSADEPIELAGAWQRCVAEDRATSCTSCRST